MVRTRLSAADILHRGVVLSLVGVCVWGIGTGFVVHRNTVRMGRGMRIPRSFLLFFLWWILTTTCTSFFFSLVVPFRGKVFWFIDDASWLTWSQIIAQREAEGLPTDVVPEKVILPKPFILHGFRRADGSVLSHEQKKVQEANEQRWAEAAQAVFRGRNSKVA